MELRLDFGQRPLERVYGDRFGQIEAHLGKAALFLKTYSLAAGDQEFADAQVFELFDSATS